MINMRKQLTVKLFCLVLLTIGTFFAVDNTTAAPADCSRTGCPIWMHCVNKVCVCDCEDDFGNCIDPAICNPQ